MATLEQAVFQDFFERTDEDPMSTNDWQTLSIKITNGVALAKSSAAWAFNNGAANKPVVADQEIRASVASSVEHATTSHIDLHGRLDDSVTEAAFSPAKGYVCRLAYLASGVRNLVFLKYDRDNAGTLKTLKTVAITTLTQSGGAAPTDLAVSQDLRFTITNTDIGVRLRAFINNDNDLSPDLDFIDLGADSSDTGPYTTHKDPGFWAFGLGMVGNAVEFFEAKDYSDIEEETVQTGRTLKQLRDAMDIEMSRGSINTLPEATKNLWLNKSQEDVRSEIGDLAIFNRREEEFTVSATNRLVTFPNTVAKIENIVNSAGVRTPIGFRFVSYSPNMGIVIQLAEQPTDKTYLVLYHKRWTELLSDTDRCLVPRMYDEAVYLGAVMRAASRASDAKWEASINRRHSRAMALMKRDLNRIRRMERTTLKVPGSVNHRHGFLRYVGGIEELWGNF